MHAINNRKARLGLFRSAGIRVPLEDVVTSTVFGPLEFMSPDDCQRSIELIREALGLPPQYSAGPLRALFWPRLFLQDEKLRSRYSEPDLVFADDEGPMIVVEIKWGAPLSDRELAAQWAALEPGDRRRAVHVLLVQEPGLYRRSVEIDRAFIDDRGIGPWTLLVRSWRSLAAIAVLSRGSDASDAVKRWASAVTAFLLREHRTAIRGWDDISLVAPTELRWRFRQPWLQGLHDVFRYEGGWTIG